MSDPTPQHEVVSCVRSHAYVKNIYLYVPAAGRVWGQSGAHQLFLSRALTLDLALTSTLTTLKWPSKQPTCSGVCSLGSEVQMYEGKEMRVKSKEKMGRTIRPFCRWSPCQTCVAPP
jgi:hypothetical protein